jgi:hypothetical protein
VTEQPVAFKILLVLYEHAQNYKTGLHVNAIFKELVARNQLGKSKEPVIEALKDLEQGDLIETTRVGKQKEVKTLKPMGQEFVKMFNDIFRYVGSCFGLMQFVYNMLDLIKYDDKKVQRRFLHEKGWTAEEIDYSEKIFATTAKLRSLCSPYEVVNVVLIRYILVLSKITDNKYAKTLLNQLIMDLIYLILSQTSAETDDELMSLTEEGYMNLASQKIKFLGNIFDHNYYNNRFIDKRVNMFLQSLKDVLLLDTFSKRVDDIVKLKADSDEEFHHERSKGVKHV